MQFCITNVFPAIIFLPYLLNLSFISLSCEGLSRRRRLLPLQLHTGISVFHGADDAGHLQVLMEPKWAPHPTGCAKIFLPLFEYHALAAA